ncbi:MAG: hypothetical protein IPL23_23800 [Saprospiraceae bacterium]|nr:hypothetical protein [Saprospiraceae bacterium]
MIVGFPYFAISFNISLMCAKGMLSPSLGLQGLKFIAFVCAQNIDLLKLRFLSNKVFTYKEARSGKEIKLDWE